MEVKDQIALLAVLIALITSLTTALFAWINYKREKLNQKIQYINLKQQYFTSLRTWADHICDLLSEAVHFSELDPARCTDNSFFERRNKIRTSLSSMIDRGKWFFPNLKAEEIGQTKEKAYRGYRQEVLNSLVSAYDVVTALDYKDGTKNRPLRQRIVDSKRVFVSEIQEILAPAERDREFEYITKSVSVLKGKPQPNNSFNRSAG
ncbi:MAG: hypothetical protein M3362_00825 [Acidobacteriota bacterium]|nr:hypothetical protein [Acidobacteriota bacterium]